MGNSQGSGQAVGHIAAVGGNIASTPDQLPVPEAQIEVSQALTSRGKTRLPVADALRGFAALWVVFYHMKEGNHLGTLSPDSWLAVLFGAGHLGVAIFFVLSGLVIAQFGPECGASLVAFRNFLVRRLIRLAPPYYFSIALALVLMLVKSRTLGAGVTLPSIPDLLAHLVFVQDLARFPPISSVYWTLCLEVQFYIMFGILMVLVNRLQGKLAADVAMAAVVTAACVVAALWPLGLLRDGVLGATFLPTWHLFLLGVLAFAAIQGRRPAVIGYCVYALILGVAALMRDDTFGLTGVLTSMVLIATSRVPMALFKTRLKLLSSLGLVSYSLYLLHNSITGVVFNITTRIFGTGSRAETIGAIVSIVACLIGAAISYVLVERPAIHLGRKWRA